LIVLQRKKGFQRFPPPPPSLGPFGAAPFGRLPLLLFCALAITSAFLAFFSSFVFLILSLISLHRKSSISRKTSVSTDVDWIIKLHLSNGKKNIPECSLSCSITDFRFLSSLLLYDLQSSTYNGPWVRFFCSATPLLNSFSSNVL